MFSGIYKLKVHFIHYFFIFFKEQDIKLILALNISNSTWSWLIQSSSIFSPYPYFHLFLFKFNLKTLTIHLLPSVLCIHFQIEFFTYILFPFLFFYGTASIWDKFRSLLLLKICFEVLCYEQMHSAFIGRSMMTVLLTEGSQELTANLFTLDYYLIKIINNLDIFLWKMISYIMNGKGSSGGLVEPRWLDYRDILH